MTQRRTVPGRIAPPDSKESRPERDDPTPAALRETAVAPAPVDTLSSAIADALPASIAVLDHTGLVQSVNASWKNFAAANGHTGNQYGVGTNYVRMCDEVQGADAATAAAVAAGIRMILDGRTREFTAEYPCHSPTQKRWFRVIVTPLSASDTDGAVVVHVDITERKQGEEALTTLNTELERHVQERTTELQIANQELEAFSHSVSHDLLAPLRHIEGFSQLLVEECGAQLDGDAKDYLDRIQLATRRMGQVIQALLDLARFGRSQIAHQAVDLRHLALSIVADLRTGDPTRRVELIVQPKLLAQGDTRLLRIALDNLLNNAWKYTSKRPSARIELGAFNRDGQVTYFVRDDGAGFDMAHSDKLFGVFQRLHPAAEFEGTGVGLATVQRIIHRHGGRIWAESTPQRGATFFFTLGTAPTDILPLARAEEARQAQ